MPTTTTEWTGTIVNGRVEVDAPAGLRDGTRVRLSVDADAGEGLPVPAEPYDREKELAILREALQDVEAGKGRPHRQVMAEIAAEFGLKPAAGE